MDDDLEVFLLVTHFFNPVRYMRLLRLVTGRTPRLKSFHVLPSLVKICLAKALCMEKTRPTLWPTGLVLLEWQVSSIIYRTPPFLSRS